MNTQDNQVPNGNDTGNQVDDVEKLKATNARLLRESQEYKTKYQAALQEKENVEAERIKVSGTMEEKLKLAEKQNQELLAKLNGTTKIVINQEVKNKVLRFAGDVHSEEDLLSSPKLKEYLEKGFDKDKLEFQDDFAKQFVEEVRKEKPYLWKSSGPIGAHTGKPGATTSSLNGGGVDFSKMTAAEEKEWILKNLK